MDYRLILLEKSLPVGVLRVQAVLQAAGHSTVPRMLGDAARTAQQAADALGIAVGQIAKSIIFRRTSDDAAVLVVTSGDRELFRFATVWAAAGHPHAVFEVSPADLQALCNAPVADVAQLAQNTNAIN